uniref:Fibronectin type-III domain-containing protein n=1 Tax=Candidatus Kentrum sp. FM TaxID=2126340 RepID=A0A450TQA7_9GAMM|nr:MAG: hypothetical protein BECKFM1743C_GA0114222_105502 [Candidatus Kentron sp. FM]VFJ73449.1 MAG: hypothetical protein BECKFM1743A_GA0114220_107192 [Candidatus Kentron sp. FM]VFK10559.1 MAG: hypothetical protein BECKFM1743B_GA0114221_101448 [Candidatus Kentron sp. FM]
MATYPLEEGKIFILGQEMSRGLKANPDLFPTPPMDATTLDEALAAYVSARGEAVAAQATAEQATATKRAALEALSGGIKSNLRYAEMMVHFDDAKLKTIGWGGRREPTPLTAPGRALDLVDTEQGEGWIKLAWEKPADGGKASTYKVLSREWGGDGEWKTADTTTALEITLAGQERGKDLEYVVVSVNRAGEGPESNTVRAVL